MAFFSGSDIWTDAELKEFVKAGELAMAKGVAALTFQGQQISYRSLAELKSTIKMMRDELENRGAIQGGGATMNKVKQVRITTKDSGFGNG